MDTLLAFAVAQAQEAQTTQAALSSGSAETAQPNMLAAQVSSLRTSTPPPTL